MARRLLGADSATVFNIQEPEEEAANQVLSSSGLIRKIIIILTPLPILFMDTILGINSVRIREQVKEKQYYYHQSLS